MTSQSALPDRSSRRAAIFRGLLVVIAIAVMVGGSGLAYFKPWRSKSNLSSRLVLQPVKQDLFIYEVTEQGEIESSANVEVACEVQSKNTAGTAILEIVPEGTNVKVNDFLVRLDSSALREELSQQQILCNTSAAAVIQAESALNTAKISREEYLNGTFRQEEQIIQSEISVAEESLRRAEDYALHSEKLAAKGYVTSLQLDADKFAVEKAKMDLATANTKLNVLRDYTRAKMLSTLEADIKTADANLKSQQNTHALDQDKLKHIQLQIDRCELKAPAAGQVVYANKSDRRGSSDVVIEAGASVRERQVIIRLPDPTKMQVKAKINESRIDRVRAGQPAVIRLDAFPDIELTGAVTKVDDYPLPGNWFNSAVKEYGTTIEINAPPPGSRPGMTAEVKIRVEETPNALQVPVQAVFERAGHTLALVRTPTGLEARKIEIGSTNEKFVVVRAGLSAADQVVMNYKSFIDTVDLPVLPPIDAERELIAKRSNAKTDASGEVRPASAVASAAPADSQSPDGEKKKRDAGGGNFDPAAIVGMLMQRSDKDGDGKLAESEVDERMRPNFARSDANSDGFIDRAELLAAMNRMRAQMAGGGGPGGPGGGGAVAAPSAGASGL
jgi:multidrug efflux pump subunit AcrA (membrane-fusion protein)